MRPTGVNGRELPPCDSKGFVYLKLRCVDTARSPQSTEPGDEVEKYFELARSRSVVLREVTPVSETVQTIFSTTSITKLMAAPALRFKSFGFAVVFLRLVVKIIYIV